MLCKEGSFMPKTLNVDSNLLNQKIDESGLRVNFIVETLGLSRQGFDKKRNGLTPFKASEVYVLCDLLKISDIEEKSKIFYPRS